MTNQIGKDKIKIISGNQIYSSYEVEIEDIEIIGEVVHIMRDFI